MTVAPPVARQKQALHVPSHAPAHPPRCTRCTPRCTCVCVSPQHPPSNQGVGYAELRRPLGRFLTATDALLLLAIAAVLVGELLLVRWLR
jgi:hypothetical protein